MSTIVVVKKDQDIVIGADTLVKFGTTKKKSGFTKNSSKITKFGTAFIATVGSAAVELILKDYFFSLKKLPEFDSDLSIFRTFRKLHNALKEDYFLNPMEDEEDSYESLQMECLIANSHGIFGVDAFRYVEEYTQFGAYGNGYRFALGAMRVAYGQNISAEEVARIGLEVAAEFDDSTEGPMEIYKIPIAKESEENRL